MIAPIIALLAVSSDVIAGCGSYVSVVDSVRHKRNYSRAERCIRQALAKRLLDPRSTDRQIAIDIGNLAALAHLSGRNAEADALYQRALTIAERGGVPDALLVANAATFYHRQQNLQLADKLYTRLEAIERRPQWLDQHAALLRSIESYAEAAKLEILAIGIRVRQALRN